MKLVKANKRSVKNIFLKKDNLLSIITILATTFIILLDVFTEFITYEAMFEAILIVLTLIAISNIIERETRLHQTELKIEKIDNQLQNLRKPFFARVSELPNIRDYSKGAKEIFTVGGTLMAYITENLNFFADCLRKGQALKFIIQNPENNGLRYLRMPAIHYSYESYVKQIEIALDRLKSLKNIPDADIQVRLSNESPTQTLTIIDGHLGGSIMNVALHLPYGDAQTRPCFFLKKEENREWFDLFYNRYYKYLWENSEVVE